MRSIRKIGLRLLLIIVVIVVYEIGVRYAYESYFASVIYTNREKSQMAGTIETLYCGTSTMQRGINMDVADQEMDTISFNIASSDQPMDGTYFLMKDMVKDNPVNTVFLGVSPETMSKDKLATKWKSLVVDRLDGAEDKMDYLIHGSSIEEWPYLLLYSVRVDDYLDFKAVKKNITKKCSKEFAEGSTHDKYYRGRGAFGRNKVYQAEPVGTLEQRKSAFNSADIYQKYEDYFKKCIEFCQEKDIEVVLLYPPMTGNKINKYKDITPIHDYYGEIAQEYGVEFWDFNYYKDLKTVFSNEFFEDEKHLNGEGGKVFARELAKVYRAYQAGEKTDKFFLDICPFYLAAE
ncbi:MAG: hypothetical protein K2M46_03925 [Lachnospiraceae bacterium]|nr:hypothetical protein [Lachnospiraceae bacterium]